MDEYKVEEIDINQATEIADMPTAVGNCTLCGEKIDDPLYWLHFTICKKCFVKGRDETVRKVSFEKDKMMTCACKSDIWHLYYNRIVCKNCGLEIAAPLGDVYRNWEGGKK